MSSGVDKKSPFDTLQVTAKKSDTNLGDYRIAKSLESDEMLLVKEHQVNVSTQIANCLQTLAKRKEIVHPNLMALKDYSCKEESQLCSSFFRYKSYYEFYDINLVKFRDFAKDPFVDYPEGIMTKFLFDMVHLS
jgi:hypothetical protein